MKQGDTNEVDQNAVYVQVLTIAGRLLWVGYSVVVILVGVSVGAAAWVARTDNRLGNIEGDVSELTTVMLGRVQSRLRNIEGAIDRGMLPATAERLKELETRLRAVEHERAHQ